MSKNKERTQNNQRFEDEANTNEQQGSLAPETQEQQTGEQGNQEQPSGDNTSASEGESSGT